jgi:hypothetical protein
MRHTGNRIGGSNPSLSARHSKSPHFPDGAFNLPQSFAFVGKNGDREQLNLCRMATKLDQAGLLRIQRQRWIFGRLLKRAGEVPRPQPSPVL